MASLGQMLQKNIVDAEIERTRKEREAEEAALREKRQEMEAVELYFRLVREQIELEIGQGKAVSTITLGRRSGKSPDNYTVSQILKVYSWNERENSIEHPKHEYHLIWGAFARWADENDLDVYFEYAYDGMGMESWYELVVKPNTNTF